ncbi:MAG TPA: anion transporter [Hyphomonas sp.]|nr:MULTISPECIES: SLC13 family permease [unclassified Hyphomonas]MAN90102.1 anion transporter [Hyphomonadaceae bacterium]HAQ76723.1 anion transporter [Hyphomonas sp.]QSR21969.1 anion transporter [Hyphomonas sp. KY3]HBL93979.1 anion transporter [Hyphomonas sp.]HCN94762.1 anion transporter [Hyphomonas sp.]|tara:strand:- start:9831 stop:11246 length:1416 start_codon:yes stop_codon:yes gene_type:complete
MLGPALAALMLLFGPPEGLSHAAWGTGALMALMAVWWATEAIPIPATSLLPLFVLPLVGAGSPAQTGSDYANHIVILLLGGFIVALGIERWNLHQRIALNVISRVGTSPGAIVFGFMLATAVLSMWISNTASTLMMVPIAISASAVLGSVSKHFTTALLLGVCYAASIGGVATPIGTPTNLIAISWLQTEAGAHIGFAQWMAFGLPAMALLLPVAWWNVTRGMPVRSENAEAVSAHVKSQLIGIGKMTVQETRVAIVFGITATLWLLRLPLQLFLEASGIELLANYGGAEVDMMIAIFGGVLMFLVPAGGGEDRGLLNWQEAEQIPWGVLLLFGGGIAMGKAISRTGLSEWIGENLRVLDVLPPLIFIVIVVALVIFLTEVTSNVATMTTLAPVLGSLAVALGTAPESLLGPAAVAASCAFMLPVATAPNAIVYGTGHITIQQMIRKGFYINLAGIVIIAAVGYWIAPLVL